MSERKREQGQGYGNRRQAARRWIGETNSRTANGHDRTLPFAEIGDYRCAHTYVHVYILAASRVITITLCLWHHRASLFSLLLFL